MTKNVVKTGKELRAKHLRSPKQVECERCVYPPDVHCLVSLLFVTRRLDPHAAHQARHVALVNQTVLGGAKMLDLQTRWVQ